MSHLKELESLLGHYSKKVAQATGYTTYIWTDCSGGYAINPDWQNSVNDYYFTFFSKGASEYKKFPTLTKLITYCNSRLILFRKFDLNKIIPKVTTIDPYYFPITFYYETHQTAIELFLHISFWTGKDLEAGQTSYNDLKLELDYTDMIQAVLWEKLEQAFDDNYDLILSAIANGRNHLKLEINP